MLLVYRHAHLAKFYYYYLFTDIWQVALYPIRRANKISSRENHIPKERVSGISCFHDVSHCDAPPSAETQVMHFIARFNSLVRLFNQTSLPARVLNVGGCDPFRAARRGCKGARGPKTISSAESDLRAIGISHPRRHE